MKKWKPNEYKDVLNSEEKLLILANDGRHLQILEKPQETKKKYYLRIKNTATLENVDTIY